MSRYGPDQGGSGFNNVFKALAAISGTLRFRSGEGCVTMDGTGFEAMDATSAERVIRKSGAHAKKGETW